jgi:mono/diheme cytochrome c family protein
MRIARCFTVVAAVAGLTGVMSPGFAAPVTPKPDIEKGHALAERFCVTCHVVSRQASTSTIPADVPSFPEIAKKPGQSMEALAGRIVIPHPPMPAIALSRQEIANVVAYIMTLKD